MNTSNTKIQRPRASTNMYTPKPVVIYRDNWVQATQRPPIHRDNLVQGQAGRKQPREPTPHHSTARGIQRQKKVQFPVLNISEIESLKRMNQKKQLGSLDGGHDLNSKQRSDEERVPTTKRGSIIKLPNVHTKSVIARKRNNTTEGNVSLPQLPTSGDKPKRKTVRFAKQPKEKLLKR